MIITALAQYYDRLRAAPEIDVPEPGYSSQKIHFCLVLGRDGTLKAVEDLRDHSGNTPQPRILDVPEPVKRSGHQVAPSFLWDKPSYCLGAAIKNDLGKPTEEKLAKEFTAFKQHFRQIMPQPQSEALQAFVAFLEHWSPSEAYELEHWEEMDGKFVVFRLDGHHEFIHETDEALAAWKKHTLDKPKEYCGRCLATGLQQPIARLHPSIKGVWGAQTKGGDLVSFQKTAYRSYGKDKSYNAPVGEDAAFAYTTALNHLLRPRTRQNVRIGDTTVVFWTERDSPAEDMFAALFDPPTEASKKPATNDETIIDGADAEELLRHMESICQGKMPQGMDSEVRCYILGLAPNASRLSVRFWETDTVGGFMHRIGQHFRDLKIVKQYDNNPTYPALWSLLLETAAQHKADNIPHVLTGALARAMLTGAPYPTAMLTAVLGRIRADKDVNYRRAAMIKAYLARQNKEVSVSLNTDRTDAPYLLGRLFAVLEKAQAEAIYGVKNADTKKRATVTLGDKYIASASATPSRVMPILLKNSFNHIAKLRKTPDTGGLAHNHEVRIQDIMNQLDGFPPTLGMIDQGHFLLGYYHQRQDFYTKKDKTPKED